ncbi:MAG: ABC-type phosphate transport system periplasmic component-like protein [Ilumatobacteraceae bacterium]|nr:ABC-type phosphate transport system periplasmic component-like protein [Ilumatobacteraceae bacterium]
MHRSAKVTAAIAAAVTVVATSGMITSAPARADYGPSGTDVVGVGAETLNYAMDFLADGDTNGDLGYNAANNVNKFVSFDSTGDGNARNSYLNGSTYASPKPLNPTVVLRAGTYPVVRPTTTATSYAAILADTATPHKIDFVKAIGKPTPDNQTAAANAGWGYLHLVQIGTDPLQVIGSTTTHAPAGLSAAELVKIYDGTYAHWSDIPGNSGGSTAAIVPLITPVGAGTRNTFLADLKAANGGVDITLAPTVQIVEPNDPNDVTGNPATDDAIMPFAIGRLALYNGYFHAPSVGGAALTSGVKALTGTTPDATPAYSTTIGIYIAFRQSDTTLGPWQPGGTKNWVQTLFSDPGGTPFVKKPAGQALIAASGITPTYSDLGNVHS